ncbi:MAG TPA: hypothetical protein VM689_13650 [Aliidongia sp.]|nr:hypothetical protein [Aliidongia sp.]
MAKLSHLLGPLALAGLVALAPLAARAEVPGPHPAYLHALADLRAAAWMLENRPGDAFVSAHEETARQEIHAAFAEIKRAAIDDGKDVNDHTGIDLPRERPGRLHRALEILRQVHGDLDHAEDVPEARELKHRALEHVQIAERETEFAIGDIEHHR